MAAAPAVIGSADGPTSVVVSDNDLWSPVINELNALGETTSQEDMSWLYIFITGFVGGLLALFTPCVWPIIPMTVSFFLKRSKDKKKGIRDAWTYGASIVVIYVTLGLAITAIFGANALNALSTNAIFNIFFCLMLVVFAASFFGAFEITLPSKWSNAVDSKAEATTGLLSIFLMAFTLSLVSFSCTGPIIGFLLVQVSTTGNVIAPAVGMLGFAIALALPFTLFALFPSWLKSMPKSGGWMNVIKVTLGFLESSFPWPTWHTAGVSSTVRPSWLCGSCSSPCWASIFWVRSSSLTTTITPRSACPASSWHWLRWLSPFTWCPVCGVLR